MEQFYLEKPSIRRKSDIVDYINELVFYNSDINGIEVLTKILDGNTFEEVLEHCLNLENEDYAKKLKKNQVKTFLLIRHSDDKIVGALNIRFNFINKMTQFDGNIGYGIRPTQRRKGYSKINLYLGLIEAKKIGLEQLKLVCEKSNLASVRIIESLGGTLVKVGIDPSDGILTNVYLINISEAIDKYKKIYEDYIYTINK